VEICYNEIKSYPVIGKIYHAYVVVTDEKGNKTFYRGGPSGNGDGASKPSGSITGKPGKYGNIECHSGTHEDGSFDFPKKKGDEGWNNDHDQNCVCKTIIDNSDPAGPTKKKLDGMIDNINKNAIPYKIFGPNSNSVAAQLIVGLVGDKDKRPKPPKGIVAPGSGDEVDILPPMRKP